MNKTHCLELRALLDLTYLPVGIGFLSTEEDYDLSKVSEAKTPLPYCKFVKKAADGESNKFSLHHIACLAGARAVGALKSDADIVSQDDIVSGRRLEKMGLHYDLCVARGMAKNMIYCSHHVHGVEVAPLCAFHSNSPHVVILICTPKVAMRVIQGYAYHFGQLKTINLGGNQAICQECTSYVFEKNEINISMLCSGTRKVAQWGDEFLAIGVPYNKLTQLINGIKKTADPMEDTKEKKHILEKSKKYNVLENLDLTLGKNYFSGGYGTLEFHKQKNNRLALKKHSHDTNDKE